MEVQLLKNAVVSDLVPRFENLLSETQAPMTVP